MLDAQKREELNMRAKKFVQGLNVQMYETEQKKKYGGLMTEHERRVNDADIKAYEDQDQKLFGKLPGIGVSHEAER